MAVLLQSRLKIASLFQVTFQQLRNRKSINPRKPPEPHFEKKLMLEICKPIILPENKPDWETCGVQPNLPQEIESHPYEKMLAEDLKRDWFSSRMICFFHVNPLSLEEKKLIRRSFLKKGMNFHIYSSHVVKLVLQGTYFSPLLHLFESPTAVLFSSEPEVSKVLKVSRTAFQITLMAGIVDGVLLSRQQLVDYSKVNREALYQQLLSLLKFSASSISKNVTYNANMLSYCLKSRSEESG